MSKLFLAWILCTSVFLVSAQVPQARQPESKRANQADQSTPGEKYLQQTRPAAKETASAQPNRGVGESTNKQDENTEINRRIMWFTGVLAFVALLQWGATMLQWNAMRRQSKFMLHGLAVSRYSAKAAKLAADAATTANENTVEAFRTNARPWVGIVETNVSPIEPREGEPNLEIRAMVRCKNFGNSPAIQVRAISGMSCQKDEKITQEAIDEQISAETDVSEFIIMPNESASGGSAPCILKLTPAHCALLNRGAMKLYYFGRVEYLDIFGGRHLTRFCSVYNPQRGVFQYYNKYNDTN